MTVKIDFTAPEFNTEKNGVYYSIKYQMYSSQPNQKEFDKTYYIKDAKARIKRMRELIGDDVRDVGITVTRGEKTPTLEDLGLKNYDELQAKKDKGMFYNVWTEIGTLRRLEVEYYLQQIYDNAIKIKIGEVVETGYPDNDKLHNAICYLIDERYKKHVNVLSHSKADFIYRGEYNQLIYDYIGKMIAEISNIDVEAEKIEIKPQLKKPLKWNADKTALGTLFGLLHKAKIIDGSQEDINRFLMAGFDGFSENTLRDNIGLKIKTTENKVLYHTETENKTLDWISLLKSKVK